MVASGVRSSWATSESSSAAAFLGGGERGGHLVEGAGEHGHLVVAGDVDACLVVAPRDWRRGDGEPCRSWRTTRGDEPADGGAGRCGAGGDAERERAGDWPEGRVEVLHDVGRDEAERVPDVAVEEARAEEKRDERGLRCRRR